MRPRPALAGAGNRASDGTSSRRGPEPGVLARDYETDRRLYADLLTRRDDALIAADLSRAAGSQRFTVLQAPSLPPGPESSNHRVLYLLGFLAALLVGLGLAALIEYRDSSFRTEDDVVDGLGMLVLATIAVLESHRSDISGQGEPATSASMLPQPLARWRWS